MGRHHRSSSPKQLSTWNSQRSPTPAWLLTVRRQLRNLPISLIDDTELAKLHVTLQEEDELSICPTLGTLKKIESFCTTDAYKGHSGVLPRHLRTRLNWEKQCAAQTDAVLTELVVELGDRHSVNRTDFYRHEHTLRITGDPYTKGVKSNLTIRDFQGGNSISIIVRNRRPHQWQLSATEVYTLLTLADEQRKARPDSDVYKVHIIVIQNYWAYRLSADIPSSYITSIIASHVEINGHIAIRRTPYFNVFEEFGLQAILRAFFEDFPLSTLSTVPPLPPVHFPPPVGRKYNKVLEASSIKQSKRRHRSKHKQHVRERKK
ncbi:uncharacterized protein BP5553_09078 [Venustampulla echinocandica]|uniref:Uncharacterized protein n=1 Tax=Venustampulla echinocandica TaxID=2656787 RepID=A0A370TDU8_9HELO|nr:uncharacterized protein BP5553_09078 [Venustampulla echinocandica]RDL32622.1 hypothetical protein BP5553_09078 [Venustampulla echinocandica]